MGEARRKALAARSGAGDESVQPQVVDTLGGRMHVRWDEGAVATPHGQLLIRPCEVSSRSRVTHPAILEVTHDTFGCLFQHGHMLVGRFA